MTTESSAIIQRWCEANGVPKKKKKRTKKRSLLCQHADRQRYGRAEHGRFCAYCPDAERTPCVLADDGPMECDYCALADCPCMAETTPERTAAYAAWENDCALGELTYTVRNSGWGQGQWMDSDRHYTKRRVCAVCGAPISNQAKGDLCRTHWHEVRWGEKRTVDAGKPNG